jgi:hypothetical protein
MGTAFGQNVQIMVLGAIGVALNLQKNFSGNVGKTEQHLLCLPALSACLPCFVPSTSHCSSKWIFVAATHSRHDQNLRFSKSTSRIKNFYSV